MAIVKLPDRFFCGEVCIKDLKKSDKAVYYWVKRFCEKRIVKK